MKPQKGYYSIVQYCPELSRFEAANIGVLLFRPVSGFLNVMTSGNNRRIIKFFGSKDDVSPTLVRRVFNESHVKLYSSEEIPKLIDEIRRTGKDINGTKKA